MYKYITRVEINDSKYSDIWTFGIKLKSSTKFEFLNTYIEFSRGNTGHKDEMLYITFLSENEDKKDAERNIKSTLRILSYLLKFPLEYEQYIKRIEIKDIPNFEKTIDYSKLKNIEYINKEISKFKKIKPLFTHNIKLLNTAQKYNYMYGFSEEAFSNYFKIIENIATYKYEVDIKKHKLSIKSPYMNEFLKNVIEDTLDIKYSDDKIKDITKKLESIIINLATDGVFYKISAFCKLYNINIDPNVLHKAIKVRNKIAHGNYVEENDIDEVYMVIANLSYEFIAYNFFNKRYSEISIDSHIEVW